MALLLPQHIQHLPPGVLIHRAGVAVAAGFPSPAQDWQESPVDLTRELVKDPLATFLIDVAGHSMVDAGIGDGDKILVDRSLTARSGDIVVAVVDNEFTIKRIFRTRDGAVLKAASRQYPDIVVTSEQDLRIFGPVTWSIRKHRGA